MPAAAMLWSAPSQTCLHMFPPPLCCSKVSQCLLHMPRLLPKLLAFAVLSAAGSSCGICNKNCNASQLVAHFHMLYYQNTSKVHAVVLKILIVWLDLVEEGLTWGSGQGWPENGVQHGCMLWLLKPGPPVVVSGARGALHCSPMQSLA